MRRSYRGISGGFAGIAGSVCGATNVASVNRFALQPFSSKPAFSNPAHP
ncbi:hypothetical protein ABIE09_003421 [Lysobacter enzymogenes]